MISCGGVYRLTRIKCCIQLTSYDSEPEIRYDVRFRNRIRVLQIEKIAHLEYLALQKFLPEFILGIRTDRPEKTA